MKIDITQIISGNYLGNRFDNSKNRLLLFFNKFGTKRFNNIRNIFISTKYKRKKNPK